MKDRDVRTVKAWGRGIKALEFPETVAVFADGGVVELIFGELFGRAEVARYCRARGAEDSNRYTRTFCDEKWRDRAPKMLTVSREMVCFSLL